MSAGASPLSGRRILVAEDDAFMMDDLCATRRGTGL